MVKPKKESAGKTYGFIGAKIGNAHLKWAFSEASVLFLRNNPEGQAYVARLENHSKGKSLTIPAHKLARAVYYMLRRNEAFDMKRFLICRRRRRSGPSWRTREGQTAVSRWR